MIQRVKVVDSVVSFDPVYGQLLQKLYKGGSQEKPWNDFLEGLRDYADSDVVAIVFRGGKHGDNLAPLCSCLRTPDTSDVEAYWKAWAEFGSSSPLLDALDNDDSVLRLSDVVPRKGVKATPHYLKLMVPYGFENAIAVRVNCAEGVSVYLTLVRGPEKPNFGLWMKDLLLDLRSHLQEALREKFDKERVEVEKIIYSDALSSLAVATVILDRDGKILTISDTADRLLQKVSCIGVADGSIVAIKSKYREEFKRLVQLAISWWENGSKFPFYEAIRLECETGNSVGVLIRSAPRSGEGLSRRVPAVVLNFEDDDSGERAPERVVASLFGLTRSEARLATYIANGKTLTEAAAILNLTESSVRTYSKKLFAKMGIGRQAELVRLLSKSTALLVRRSTAEGQPFHRV